MELTSSLDIVNIRKKLLTRETDLEVISVKMLKEVRGR